ncbi:hypothetical protein SELMODRAFT_422369 [Selaginella moellendorffii]|uniref:Uncharacterized protein n=1 Tax=Selaginella moellendorffii TaxID=88036 RepID=D8SI66_SELML|nr:hypothetical protein SELMODRAFT_422369 [Selaginella moellendorffii]
MRSLSFRGRTNFGIDVRSDSCGWIIYWRLMFIAAYRMVQDTWKDKKEEDQQQKDEEQADLQKEEDEEKEKEEEEEEEEEQEESSKIIISKQEKESLLVYELLRRPDAAAKLAPAGLDPVHDIQLRHDADGIYNAQLVERISKMLNKLKNYFPDSEDKLKGTPYAGSSSGDMPYNIDTDRTLEEITRSFDKAAKQGCTCREN